MSQKWIMRNGQKIAIRDMSDGHLSRAIAMLERNHQQALRQARRMEMSVSGEAANDAATSIITEMESVRSRHPLYEALVAEKLRRGEGTS